MAHLSRILHYIHHQDPTRALVCDPLGLVSPGGEARISPPASDASSETFEIRRMSLMERGTPSIQTIPHETKPPEVIDMNDINRVNCAIFWRLEFQHNRHLVSRIPSALC